jgi:hypothetical protein
LRCADERRGGSSTTWRIAGGDHALWRTAEEPLSVTSGALRALALFGRVALSRYRSAARVDLGAAAERERGTPALPPGCR